MRLLVTDVTEMSADRFCIAGWDVDDHRMVRPLPNGDNWPGSLLRRLRLVPGTQISATPDYRPHNGDWPHRTEDTRVVADEIRVVSRASFDWFGADAPPAHPTVAAAFGGHLQDNGRWQGHRKALHVPAGTPISSLSAIVVPRRNVEFIEDFGKLKAQIDDGADRYMLSVSSHALKSAWERSGRKSVASALPKGRRFHIRLGLARPLDTPPRCYLMLNGVHG